MTKKRAISMVLMTGLLSGAAVFGMNGPAQADPWKRESTRYDTLVSCNASGSYGIRYDIWDRYECEWRMGAYDLWTQRN
jgi:hypothetical protein